MKGLGDMKYRLLSQMYNTGRNTPAWNLNEWWAEKRRMRLKEENRISHERTFFNYEEGCLGLPGRHLCKSWFFIPGRMAAAYKVGSPDSVSQVRRHKRSWGEGNGCLEHPEKARGSAHKMKQPLPAVDSCTPVETLLSEQSGCRQRQRGRTLPDFIISDLWASKDRPGKQQFTASWKCQRERWSLGSIPWHPSESHFLGDVGQPEQGRGISQGGGIGLFPALILRSRDPKGQRTGKKELRCPKNARVRSQSHS